MRSIILSFVSVLFLSSCQQIYFMLTTMAASPTSNAQVTAATSIPFTQSKDPANYKSVDYKNIVTLLIYKENGIYAYTGKDVSSGKKYGYQNNSLRNFLSGKKKDIGNELIVCIKSSGATYKNTVDVLDEMNINNIKKYTLTEMADNEKIFIEKIGN